MKTDNYIGVDRVDLIDADDTNETKMRYWTFQYLGDRMAGSYAKGTLWEIKRSVHLASTLIATELEKSDYEERVGRLKEPK